MSTTTLTKAGTKNVEQVILLDATTGDPASLGGGTQYADGATAATPTGTQINWNDAGTQRAVSAAKPLPVTASIDTTGLATSAGQTTGNSSLSSIDGKITAVNTGAVVVSSSALPSGASTSANQTTIIGHVDGIETLIGTTNTTLGTIDTDTGNISTKIDTLAGAVSGTEVQVDIVASLPAGTNAIGKLSANSGVDIGDVDVTSAVITGGAVAHDGADSGNPIKIGARATNVEIAPVVNNDRSDLVTTLTGKLIVQPYTNPENIVSGVTSAMTGTTSTSVVAAPASGLRNYITQITVGNSHATVGTFVNIQDGSGGTTIWTIPAAAVYGGATINFDPPLRQPTTATALFCACVTTGSNTIVAANGFKAA